MKFVRYVYGMVSRNSGAFVDDDMIVVELVEVVVEVVEEIQ